ncbi:MAG: DUF1553 domain-containing protein [Planctomycetota bacterium]|nr:DUF1553 domain-containing protein [Planctomycetota bacterium]
MFLKNILFALLVLVAATYLVFEVLPGDRGFPDNRLLPDLVSLRKVAREVDAEFEEKWSEKKLDNAGPAGDLIVARRLSLGLTGTIPSLEEIRKLEAVDPDHRIDWWTAYLLQDDRSADYVAERLARIYVGTEDGPFIIFRRRRFVMWLSEQLKKNRPYDQLVSDLISNNGLWTDTPSVNFYTVTIDGNQGQPDPIRLAARTTRAFLGLRIDCLQCHDDALGTMELGDPSQPRPGTQEDFHKLAAGFASVRQVAAGLQDTPAQQPYRYKFLGADQERIVPFEVPFQAELVPSAGSTREKLAGWVTHRNNLAFSRAIVNRVWAILAGKPLYDPIDDLPLFGNRPPGLDLLAKDFAEHGFDLRRLIRIIAQTKVYRLSSTASFEVTEQQESQWAVFPQTPLRPEQVVGGIVQATSLKTINRDSNVFQRLATFSDIGDFIVRYGDAGEDEFRNRSGTIQQKNIMMNGKLVGERTQANDLMVNAAGQIARMAEGDQQAIETLFLVVLTRQPTPGESEFLVNLLREAANENQRTRVIEDILWSLFNKLEFLRNH